MIPGFRSSRVETGAGAIFVATGGSGVPLLLLHGFPETHLMWRDLAPRLAKHHTVICADLPGYGQSDCPPSDDGHTPYSKRAMANQLVDAMAVLGHRRFAVAGHDRGSRVAYRMALDHPQNVTMLAALDIIPTNALWERSDARLMLSFWPFSFLAQPAPLPERLIGGDPGAVIDDALSNWGTPIATFPLEVRRAYRAQLSDTARVHAICEEYRAAATIDRVHDRADIDHRHRIVCPTLVLWSEKGGLNTWYADEGGPLAIWRSYADKVEGSAVSGGHFFPEEDPAGVADRLISFFGKS